MGHPVCHRLCTIPLLILSVILKLQASVRRRLYFSERHRGGGQSLPRRDQRTPGEAHRATPHTRPPAGPDVLSQETTLHALEHLRHILSKALMWLEKKDRKLREVSYLNANGQISK